MPQPGRRCPRRAAFGLPGHTLHGSGSPDGSAEHSGHHWTLANIGTIHFPESGLQLLTFHYGKGNNYAYFEFEPAQPLPPEKQ